jgi:hypothetical protein
MTPNATVNYMAAQTERQLLEAKAARAWIVDEAARNRTPGSGPSRLPMRLLAMLAVRFNGHHGAVKTPPPIPHSTLGMADPAR